MKRSEALSRLWAKQLSVLQAPPRPTIPPLPDDAVRLGVDTRSARPVWIDRETRTQHVYVIGKSGKGKTTLLRNMIEQDMRLGHGLAVLAPDDEFYRDFLLPAIPEHRIRDVVYVDPGDMDRPVPLNPLYLAPNEDLHEKVDETYNVFMRLVEGKGGESSGAPRMERILRATLQTLMVIPNRTLLDIPRLLRRNPEGEKFRAWATEQLSDEFLRSFWTEDYPGFDKVAHQAVMNRLDRLMTPPVRRMLCTPGACLNFRDAIDSNKILLFRVTASALKGAGNAHIVGQLIVAKLKLAALSRQDVPESQRPFFPVFIDEFQHFCGGSIEDYGEMFSRTRKYRVPLTVAHLETGELSDPLLRHILGTVSTLVFFATGASDARRLCREMVYRREDDGKLVSLDPNEVVYLPRGLVFARVNERVQQVATLPAPDRGTSERARQVVETSRQLYGVGAGAPPGSQRAISRSEAPLPLEQIDPGDVFGS